MTTASGAVVFMSGDSGAFVQAEFGCPQVGLSIDEVGDVWYVWLMLDELETPSLYPSDVATAEYVNDAELNTIYWKVTITRYPSELLPWQRVVGVSGDWPKGVYAVKVCGKEFRAPSPPAAEF